jgi:hypothetical protein
MRYPLHLHQHTYQTGRSTETALHSLVYKIEWVLKAGLVALGAFLDTEGAFDNTTFQFMCRPEEEHGG